MTAAVAKPPPNPPPPIDYAPPPPWHRRRGRRAMVALVTVALVIAGWRYGPPAYRQARTLYWQQQCLAFSLPPDQVVYEEDPAGMAALPVGRDGYTRISPTPAVCHTPPCYTGFTGGSEPPGAVVFMHERVTKAGQRRLVVIRRVRSGFDAGFDPVLSLSVQTYAPATWRAAAVAGTDWHLGPDNFVFPAGPPDVCIYAGQADPADASHLTVRYRAWGQMHMVDGHLNAAGDDVDWTERPSPATRPADRG